MGVGERVKPPPPEGGGEVSQLQNNFIKNLLIPFSETKVSLTTHNNFFFNMFKNPSNESSILFLYNHRKQIALVAGLAQNVLSRAFFKASRWRIPICHGQVSISVCIA